MNNKFKKIIFVFLVFLMLPNFVLAAPTITNTSGTFTHGQSVTIFGNGFGSHGDHNNISDTYQGNHFLNFRFKDFEDGMAVSDGFSYSGANANGAWTAQNGGPTNSNKYGKCTYNGGRLTALSTENFGSTGTWFSSFWFMIPANTSSGKFFRNYIGSGTDDYYFSVDTIADNTIKGHSEADDGGTNWTSGSVSNGAWQRLDFLANASAGYMDMTVWQNGVQIYYTNSWGDNLVYSPNGHSIDLCNMRDDSNGSYNYDDVYFDYTATRVEICSGGTWVNRGECNIQIPTAWSDTSMNLKVNKGTFLDGTSKYLYVVNSNNVANANGFPISFGSSGTSDTTAPMSPTGLSVL